MKPVEIDIRSCFANLKVEPNLDIETSTVEFSFEAFEFDNFAWLICCKMNGSFEMQKVPSWAGWLSKTATDNEGTISNVEYLAQLSESINENSTVQYILDKSLAASQEVGQEYAIVTFDLAVAKKHMHWFGKIQHS